MKKLLYLLVVLFLLLPCISCAEVRTYSVAGVTFANDDGSSRQAVLKKAYDTSGNFSKHPGSLKRYLYKGADAIYVLLNGKIVGNIPAEDVAEVINYIDAISNVYVTVSRFNADDGDLIYYARVGISSNAIPAATTKPRVTAKPNYTSSNASNSFTKNTFDGIDSLIFVLILLYISIIGIWIFVKVSPWQHKLLSALVVIALWTFVRSIILELFDLELSGFIPITLSYLVFYTIGKFHYNHLIDKPVREYEPKPAKSHASKTAKENAKHVLSICSGLIDKFEGTSTTKPSCKNDLLKSIEQQLERSYAELETWQDYDTDYLRIAHTMLFHHSFDLLSSGKYHMYTNTLSPFNCGDNMYSVCIRTLEAGVERHYLSVEEKEQQIELLKKNIASVG